MGGDTDPKTFRCSHSSVSKPMGLILFGVTNRFRYLIKTCILHIHRHTHTHTHTEAEARVRALKCTPKLTL